MTKAGTGRAAPQKQGVAGKALSQIAKSGDVNVSPVKNRTGGAESIVIMGIGGEIRDVAGNRASGQVDIVDGYVTKIRDTHGRELPPTRNHWKLYRPTEEDRAAQDDPETLLFPFFIAPSSDDIRNSLSTLLRVADSLGSRGHDLVNTLLQESVALLKRAPLADSTMTEDEARALVESGAFTAEELAETEERVAAGELDEVVRRTELSAVRDTLSAADVAELLGVDPSRVRHRQAKGSLYAFMVGGKRRYPIWQFADGDRQPVPGLSAVVAALPEGMHPASVEGFMTTPNEALRLEDAGDSNQGQSVTPVVWLRQGGDVEAVVSVLQNRFIL